MIGRLYYTGCRSITGSEMLQRSRASYASIPIPISEATNGSLKPKLSDKRYERNLCPMRATTILPLSRLAFLLPALLPLASA
jgi:hypothetical protein